ncbi:MAG: hypothetical protein GY754_33660 [bacterium]|nr:hypothetical protein [bacterium]
MQLGHYAVALTISSFAPELTGGEMEAFSLESMALALAFQQLPNLDAIPIWLKWAKPSFHCTWSHSIFMAMLLALCILPFSTSWAILCIVSLLIHYMIDLPSSVGLPLLLPFSKKRFTVNLWADTGFWGWESFKGTYEQSWTWILEGGSYLVLLIRVYQKAVWPFG